jgi:PIN domain nuclease of toxin-antitoxin system
MNYLIDTHALIWFITERDKLPLLPRCLSRIRELHRVDL